MCKLSCRTATLDDIALIRSLADGVWQATYADILSPEQIRYMFDLMYSPAALREQMCVKHHTFLIVSLDALPCAYISIEPLGGGRYNFQKIYARRAVHGQGVGRYMIERGLDYVRHTEQGQPAMVELFVNRRNPAVAFYRHMGFAIVGERDYDIGEGYFMNDYIMELSVR